MHTFTDVCCYARHATVSIKSYSLEMGPDGRRCDYLRFGTERQIAAVIAMMTRP